MSYIAADATWTNWAGDQSCRPAAFERPRGREELAAVLARARERNWKVRVAGAGHSFGDNVLTDGLLLSLDRMTSVSDPDEAGDVRVDAGISLHALNEELDARGRALENLGDISVQSLAGATATGTHGTGSRYRNISANIRSIELMSADGDTLELDREIDADSWRAARISLGALGVVTAITMKTLPSFTLHGVDSTQPLEDVFDELDQLVAMNDHFEFYSFPHSDTAWTRTNNRVDEQPRPRSRSSEWLHDDLLVNTAFGLACRTGRRFPKAIPHINRMAAVLSGGAERVDRSYRIFASPRRVRFTESEYAVPREHVVTVVREVRRVIETHGYDVNFPIEVRFVAPDDALLSPAAGRETAYVAAHVFEGMEWEPYLRSVAAIAREVGGRPHWGKRHFETAASLRPLYPDWDLFQDVRRRLDPNGLFANGYIDRVLGAPVAG
jgi:L-gulono-1,4-lactone dehydrogenase